MSDFIYNRWQHPIIQQALKTRRVLILAGPRQCGKTTLANKLATAKSLYRTLDNLTTLQAALDAPEDFVQHGNELMIIDEIQRAPSLLLAIKQDVDTLHTPGRFLLTGSANIQALPGVTESLAGRVRKIRLRPLAYGEIHKKPPQFLTLAFSQKFHISEEKNNKKNYIDYALRGGYPEAIKLNLVDNHQWHRDYIEALMERDLKEIINIKRQDRIYKLLEVLAGWSSKFMDISAIGSNLSLSRSTIESYINTLEALYLVERVRPWSKTDYDRVTKRDKLFMTDTGLMASILEWTPDKVELNGDLNGKLIETFVFNQLMAILEAQPERYQLYHYRDSEKREIDFIINNAQGDLLGIEVKAGSAITHDSFKHLKWFKEHMAKEQNFIGIILYTGPEVLCFKGSFWAVPINALWA